MKLRVLFAVLLWLSSFGMLSKSAAADSFDCNALGCSEVLPDAERFAFEEDHLFATGYNAAGEVVGWVARSVDLVEIKAYSGNPLETLIALGPDGIIKGAKLIKHHEPILLVGIPVKKLHDFIAKYVGLPATSKVVVGSSENPDDIEVDMISGATVTALAQNQTILKTARTLGVATGAVSMADARPGHFINKDTPLTWQQMMADGVFGRITVMEAQIGLENPEGVLVDLWYTIIDAPQIGRAILGDLDYEHQMADLEPGQHLFVIFGNGSGSFKGSAFVRGGQFDRVRITQGLTELVFRDTDYKNFPTPQAVGSPQFKEGAVFITRGGSLDPGSEYNLVFLGSRYTGAVEREFFEFQTSHKLPGNVYQVDDIDEPMYVQAWRNRANDIVYLLIYLFAVLLIFILRKYSTRYVKVLMGLHIALMAIGFVLIGLYMHAQPSVTQILTLVGTVLGHASWELFVTAPLIFILWIFIAMVSLIWGRGVFCGWVCPYGSMTELLNKIAIKLKIRQFEIPKKFTYIRYGILVALIGIFLWDSIQGELMAEVEPFKSTFLLKPWDRSFGYFAYWLLLFAASSVFFRPFCRILCPMGAALALLGSFRLSGPHRREFCSSCKICAKLCEPRAIRDDGTIDPRDCLSCMECEATYRNDDKCPPLVVIKKLNSKSTKSDHDLVQLKKMKKARKDV